MMNPLRFGRRIVGKWLERQGYVLAPIDEWQHVRTMRNVHRNDVIEIEGLYRTFVFPDLPRNEGRADALHNLHGTTIGEAIYIVNQLHQALKVGGDVCEFGCNEGATSRLLANEILSDTCRALWLFDSFEGLPAPAAQDRLIDDFRTLGSMNRYQGSMRALEQQVRENLNMVPFPENRTRVIKGWIEKTLTMPSVPIHVSFAYVDLDFYEPIKLALAFLDQTMPPGGGIVVDDYGFFSEGVQLAVDEFVAASNGRYVMHIPIPVAGKFCVLEKVA